MMELNAYASNTANYYSYGGNEEMAVFMKGQAYVKIEGIEHFLHK